ncbi:MAG: glycoside hydrolase family 3 C-terminal domain-containing protein, partial [Candidatus Auribacterota bacterium]|nr:glycoside hydrolase family 3 C-terminal domain-containing protein [Candidatus Auribacterota bacterium]
SVIDDKVRRILRVKFLLGLFDEEVKNYKGAANTKEHRQLVREVAEGGIVLLKNDNNVLPLNLKEIKSIAVIGPNASEARLGGGGSSQVGPPYSVSPLNALKFRALKNKYGNKVTVNYTKGCNMPNDLNEIPSSAFRPSSSSKEHGLKAEYFNNANLTGSPVITRIDKSVNFDWGGISPGKGIGNDNFSARWTGKLIPPKTGKYNLRLLSDDGSRLYLDNKLIVNSWWDHAPEAHEVVMDLVEGKEYDVRIEFYEKGGGALMKFGWIAPGSTMIQEAVEAAKKSDAAVVFVGLNNLIEGEGVDRENMLLPEGQDKLIEAVNAVNKNTIVVLVNGTPVNMEKWVEKVPSIMEVWYPGQEGGNAIVNILFGDVNPSGKLSVTFPKNLKDNPSYGNYPGGGGKVYYKEGIFVGYRHYDKNNIEPQFPFGHGLSYSEFEYSNLVVNPEQTEDGEVSVQVDIKNVSGREGKEVVQLYVTDEQSSLERPPKELKAFKKVSLKPGEKKTVRLKLDKSSLSFYDQGKKKWVAEPGDFEVLIGSSSRDIRLKDSFTLTD